MGGGSTQKRLHQDPRWMERGKKKAQGRVVVRETRRGNAGEHGRGEGMRKKTTGSESCKRRGTSRQAEEPARPGKGTKEAFLLWLSEPTQANSSLAWLSHTQKEGKDWQLLASGWENQESQQQQLCACPPTDSGFHWVEGREISNTSCQE